MTTTKTQEFVKGLLTFYPHLRDDDNDLVAFYFDNELAKKGFISDKITASKFLDIYSKGQLTKADSILRARRFIQQHHPELRGKKWKERHRQEKEVREHYAST